MEEPPIFLKKPIKEKKKILLFNVEYEEDAEKQEKDRYRYVEFLEKMYDDFLSSKYPKD